MLNKDVIRNIIILTITFIFLILLITVISLVTSIIKYKDDNYYIIGNDKIPSIYNVLGKRKLYSFKNFDDNNKIVYIYKYKDINNPKSDLSNYIDTLKNDYNYYYTSDINLTLSKGTFQLSNNSMSENMIIIIDISYDKDSYEIKITKAHGTINTYK